MEQQYEQRGKLHITELGGQVLVSTEANFELLRAHVEEGADAKLVKGTDNKTGRPWFWVNDPNEKYQAKPSGMGNPTSNGYGSRQGGGGLRLGSGNGSSLASLEAKVDTILQILKDNLSQG